MASPLLSHISHLFSHVSSTYKNVVEEQHFVSTYLSLFCTLQRTQFTTHRNMFVFMGYEADTKCVPLNMTSVRFVRNTNGQVLRSKEAQVLSMCHIYFNVEIPR
jgi:hypothetical protein